MVHRKFCEGLSIKADIRFFHGAHEFGVGEAVHAGGGVHAKGPEISELALLGAAMAKSVLTGLADSLVRDALFGRAVKAIAFRLRQDVSAAFGL